MNKMSIDREEILSCYMFDREWIFRIYKELKNQSQENKQPNLKIGYESEQRVLSRRKITSKKFSSLIAIKEMQVKTTLRLHITQAKWLRLYLHIIYVCIHIYNLSYISHIYIYRCSKDVGKGEHAFIDDRIVNWCSPN